MIILAVDRSGNIAVPASTSHPHRFISESSRNTSTSANTGHWRICLARQVQMSSKSNSKSMPDRLSMRASYLDVSCSGFMSRLPSSHCFFNNTSLAPTISHAHDDSTWTTHNLSNKTAWCLVLGWVSLISTTSLRTQRVCTRNATESRVTPHSSFSSRRSRRLPLPPHLIDRCRGPRFCPTEHTPSLASSPATSTLGSYPHTWPTSLPLGTSSCPSPIPRPPSSERYSTPRTPAETAQRRGCGR